MKKSKLYTRTGDEGKTGLVSGNRILKSDSRIDLYGELDELNSRVGLVCSYLSEKNHFHEVGFLQNLQSALFDLGSNMACEFENRAKYSLPQLTEVLVKELEDAIDKMDSELGALKNFILPGGTVSASAIHMARTCTRTVERKLVYFQVESQEELPFLSLIFLNRLSDYLFVLGRHINKKEGGEEIYWKPRT